MRIDNLFSNSEKDSFVALNLAFPGSIETARSKEGVRVLRKVFDQYPDAKIQEDNKEKF